MHSDRIIKVELEDYLMYDKLGTAAIEYATTVDRLVNAAIKKLFDDLEFVRGLRVGKTTHH